MFLRTITIKNADQEIISGALLCGVAVPQIGSNFLVYSLNEEVEGDKTRVYIAMLHKTSDKYVLSQVDSGHEWTVAAHVFKQLVRRAAHGDLQSHVDIPYHLIDLTDCDLPVAEVEDHRPLGIKKALITKLISMRDQERLPAIERTAPIVSGVSALFTEPDGSYEHDDSQLLTLLDTAEMPGDDIIQLTSQDAKGLDNGSSIYAEAADEQKAEGVVQHSGDFSSAPASYTSEELLAAPMLTASFIDGSQISSNAEASDLYSADGAPGLALDNEGEPDVLEVTALATTAAQEETDMKLPVSSSMVERLRVDDSQSEQFRQDMQSTLAELEGLVGDLGSEPLNDMTLEENGSDLGAEDAGMDSLLPVAQVDEHEVGSTDFIRSNLAVSAMTEVDGASEGASMSPLLQPRAEEMLDPEHSAKNLKELESIQPFENASLPGADTEHLLLDVESTLANVAGMAQELVQQKLGAMKQQETLEGLKSQLQERERQLVEKEEGLMQLQSQLQQERVAADRAADNNARIIAERSSALQQLAESLEARERNAIRRSELLQLGQQRLEVLSKQQRARDLKLEARELDIQKKSAELVERLKQLTNAKKKLSSIVKNFNETVTFNNSLHAISSIPLGEGECSPDGVV